LRRFLTTSSRSSLNRAAYWYTRLKSEHAYYLKENLGSDIIEGAAVYVEVVGTLTGTRGCGLPESELQEWVQERLDSLLPRLPAHYVNPLSISYDLIPYALFTARKLGRMDVCPRFEKGEHA